jgi:hypothetical protein
MSIIFAKGEKRQTVRKCIEELGLQVTYGAAKRWFKKNYQATLADATFYHVRQAMQREAVKQNLIPVKQSGCSLETAVQIVKQVQDLVNKIGKEEVKKVIDLL